MEEELQDLSPLGIGDGFPASFIGISNWFCVESTL